MMLSSKPISSPSRTDKFPPPLMTFSRSNGGSRSRGRSRSSPMFIRKKNTAIETQEPTSPKVTCMGQVRVKRSKQSASKVSHNSTTKRWCRWIHKSLFCNHFTRKPKSRTSRPVWRRWFLFYHMGCGKKVEIIGNTARTESKREEETEEYDIPEEEHEVAEVFVAPTPPKNALILMRCRSEPHRASSLANRFWDSPLRVENAGEDKTEQKNRANFENEEEEEEKKEKEETPTSEKEPISRDSATESRTGSEIEEKLGFCKGFVENSSTERSSKISNIEDELSTIGDSARPLILTRCKSEPAIRSGKLDSETSFWKKRRLGFGERFPQPHVYD